MAPRKHTTREKRHFPCRYQGCNTSVHSITALRAHHRSHSGDKPWHCDRPDCDAKFTVQRELYVHIQSTHCEKYTGAQMPSLGMLGNELSVQPNANKGSDGDSRVADRTYENDLKEATEIADNCAYFASQLRAARGKAIAEWAGGDFQNAHRWAVYVSEQLQDATNNDAVASVLRTKSMNIQAMRNSERLLFDSVLGCDAVDEKMLQPLCSSVAALQETGDSAAYKRSVSALRESFAASLRRKQALCLLHEAWVAVEPAQATPIREHEVIANGAAQVLMAAHRRYSTNPDVWKHMSLLADVDGGPELLLREALSAEGTASRKRAIAAVIAACDKDTNGGWKVMESVPVDIMAGACSISFALYNRYIGLLFRVLSADRHVSTDNGTENDRKCKKMVAVNSLKELATSNGQVGSLTRTLIERFIDRNAFSP